MFRIKIGFRDADGALAITKDALAERIAAIAEEEVAAWRPASGRVTHEMEAGVARVQQYLTYLWDGAIPPFKGRIFDPREDPWSAVFVCYCVTRAFEDLGGREASGDAFRERVPLVRSKAHWVYAQSAYRAQRPASDRRQALGRYWAYDAGLPLEVGDIVVKDRRRLGRGEPNLAFGDLRTRGFTATHGDIVVALEDDTARLIGGNVSSSVTRFSYPLTTDGRIDRTKSTWEAPRVFTVLRLMPALELVTASGRSYFSSVPEELRPHRDDAAVPAGEAGCASGKDVLFPSGQRLCVAEEPALVKADAEHWDAFADYAGLSPSPLLEVEGKGGVRLATNFTVSEFIRSGEKHARIDPGLIVLLQQLRESLGRPVQVTSGYRSWKCHQALHARLLQEDKALWTTPTRSEHTHGIAADIRVAGMTSLELAKRAIDVFGRDMGLRIGMPNHTIHVDTNPYWAIWTYGDSSEAAREELVHYRNSPPGKVHQDQVDTEEDREPEERPRLILTRRGIEFEQHSVGSCNDRQRAGFAYFAKGGMQHYYRTTKGEGASTIVKGYRSILAVEQPDGAVLEFDCIERANGFVHVRPGTYAATLTPRASRPSNQEVHVTGNVFIHASNHPCQLDGCIAPGTEEWHGYGVKDSSAALREIIEALGGWQQGRCFEMEVRGTKTTPG